jgi:hypothetical protein
LTEIYLHKGVDLRFDEDELMDIRTVPVNDAIRIGLMKKWLYVMLNGFMGKVNGDWNDKAYAKTLLRETMTITDEALLYYALCHVGAGANWVNTFAKAKAKLVLGGEEKYKDMEVVRAEVKILLKKENMKRGSTYLFALNYLVDNLVPVCEHVKKERLSDVGKAWDDHLQTIYQMELAKHAENSEQSKMTKVSAAKKTMDKLNKLADMMSDY